VTRTDVTPRRTTQRTGLRGFLDKGGFWRLLVVLVAYLAVYLGAGKVTAAVWPSYVDDDVDVLSSVEAVFFQITLGLLVGAAVLIAFVAYTGWGTDIFGRQRVYRSWWMWIAPVVAALPILFRVLGIDWGGRPLQIVLLVLASGLLIGFVEELLYRGIAVRMLRGGGLREWSVAALSSLLFATSHTVNLLSGQALRTVGATVVYTFAFGVVMYLSMRVTRFIVVAMLLHGLTDPTTILASGGVDKIGGTDGTTGIAVYGVFSTFLLIGVGYVLLLFVRGKYGEAPDPRS
jgi:membrane protease YdiL (CAAX protease family)